MLNEKCLILKIWTFVSERNIGLSGVVKKYPAPKLILPRP